MTYRSGELYDSSLKIFALLGRNECGRDQQCEVVDNDQYELSFPLNDVSVEVPVRLRHQRLGLVRDLDVGLFLYYQTCVTVLVQLEGL